MEHLSEWRNLRSITSNLSCNYTAAVTPLKWRLCQHSYYIRNPVFKGWWVICKKHFSLNNCSGCSEATSRYWPCHSRMWSCHVFCNMPRLNLAIYFAHERIFSKLGNYLEGLGVCAFLLLSKHKLWVGKKPRVGNMFTNKDYNRWNASFSELIKLGFFFPACHPQCWF